MVIMEGIVLVIFKWSCPLTGIARKYSDSTKRQLLYFFAQLVGQHNKAIFTTLFLAGLVLVLFRVIYK